VDNSKNSPSSMQEKSPRTLSTPGASNKSFDRSGGSVFRLKRGAAKVE
jgi:hypothetical protein